MKKQYIGVIVSIFAVLSTVFFEMRKYAPDYQFTVLETGNTIIAALSVITYLIIDKQLNGRPQAFIRSVYASSFLKLMVCMISIMVYVFVNKNGIHKPSVFVLFGVYAIYTVTETLILSKLVRKK